MIRFKIQIGKYFLKKNDTQRGWSGLKKIIKSSPFYSPSQSFILKIKKVTRISKRSTQPVC